MADHILVRIEEFEYSIPLPIPTLQDEPPRVGDLLQQAASLHSNAGNDLIDSSCLVLIDSQGLSVDKETALDALTLAVWQIRIAPRVIEEAAAVSDIFDISTSLVNGNGDEASEPHTHTHTHTDTTTPQERRTDSMIDELSIASISEIEAFDVSGVSTLEISETVGECVAEALEDTSEGDVASSEHLSLSLQISEPVQIIEVEVAEIPCAELRKLLTHMQLRLSKILTPDLEKELEAKRLSLAGRRARGITPTKLNTNRPAKLVNQAKPSATVKAGPRTMRKASSLKTMSSANSAANNNARASAKKEPAAKEKARPYSAKKTGGASDSADPLRRKSLTSSQLQRSRAQSNPATPVEDRKAQDLPQRNTSAPRKTNQLYTAAKVLQAANAFKKSVRPSSAAKVGRAASHPETSVPSPIPPQAGRQAKFSKADMNSADKKDEHLKHRSSPSSPITPNTQSLTPTRTVSFRASKQTRTPPPPNPSQSSDDLKPPPAPVSGPHRGVHPSDTAPTKASFRGSKPTNSQSPPRFRGAKPPAAGLVPKPTEAKIPFQKILEAKPNKT